MSVEESFKGLKVLVTGASRGIGKGIAIQLNKYGAQVYAVSKNPENLKKLSAAYPGIQTVAVDLEDWDATRKALENIEVCDHIVNNAGIIQPQYLLDVTKDAFDKIMNVNVRAVVNVTQIMVKKLVEAKKTGTIVNISSVCSKTFWPMDSIYCASKAAIDSLTKTMAREFGPYGIRVNAVNPGNVLTDMVAFEEIEYKAKGLDMDALFKDRYPIPGNNVVEMDEIVRCTLFLLSNVNKMVNGETMVVDGGFRTT